MQQYPSDPIGLFALSVLWEWFRSAAWTAFIPDNLGSCHRRLGALPHGPAEAPKEVPFYFTIGTVAGIVLPALLYRLVARFGLASLMGFAPFRLPLASATAVGRSG
jgi:hypothetical protein